MTPTPIGVATSVGADRDLILTAAQDFVEARLDGDGARLARVVHPEAVLRRVRSDRSGARFLEHYGASKLIAWAASQPGATASRDATTPEPRIELLDRFWLIATVRVALDAGVEYLQLAKTGADWRVAAGLASANAAHADDGPVDHTAVCAPAQDYAEGWYAADAARMARAMHPALFKRSLRFTTAGTPFIEYINYSELVCWTARTEPTPAERRRHDIRLLDRFHNTAVVRLAFLEAREPDDPDDVESLLVVNLDGSWRIIDVLWEDDRTTNPDPFHGAWGHHWDPDR